MKAGFKAMDSDMHVMEPCDLWQKYIDKNFIDRAPVGLNRHKRDLGVRVEGKILPRQTPKPNTALGPIRERILNDRYAEEEARTIGDSSEGWGDEDPSENALRDELGMPRRRDINTPTTPHEGHISGPTDHRPGADP